MSTEILDEAGKVVTPRGAKAFKKWSPKEWSPIYEAIVALSCTGLNNEEVGKRFGYGKQQVSNILNTPQAKKIRELIVNKLNKDNTATISARLERLNESALKHVEFVLDRPTEDFKNPLAIFDRSMAFLKSSGKVKTDEHMMNIANTTNVTNNVIGKAMILNAGATELLSEGLKKANQVQVIHDGAIGNNKLKSGEPDGQSITP